MSSKILHGDNIELLKELSDNSVDSIVTDPPYGIRFMGKSWDSFDIIEKGNQRDNYKVGEKRAATGRTKTGFGHSIEAGKYDLSAAAAAAFQVWTQKWAAECLRVLKPGGHLISFCGCRTYHRMTCGIEDAGFEIRDQIQWLFGSGFPKSHNLKDEWEGWGTALKPANEPICVARKPIEKGLSIAENVSKWGVGAINLDGCRITTTEETRRNSKGGDNGFNSTSTFKIRDRKIEDQPLPDGRFPANIIFDEDAAIMLDKQTGNLRSGTAKPLNTPKQNNVFGKFNKANINYLPGNEGGASRFFYCAKSSSDERNAGCEQLEKKEGGLTSNTSGQHITRKDGGRPGPVANFHPTVKPISLMRWLIRLITPRGGLCIDPFAGSGTTGCAAAFEDIDIILIEREEEYIPIIEARTAYWQKQANRERYIQSLKDSVQTLF